MINGGIQYTGFAIKPAQLASEVAGGTWGYSGPNNRQVILCADADRDNGLRTWLTAMGLWFLEGEGVYNNEEPELCFIMNLDDFAKHVGRIHVFIENQESVLRLEHLVGQNWRDAYLVYINGREGTPYQPMYPDIEAVTPENQPLLCEHIGTFLEVTEKAAKLATGYSKFNGKYFAVIKNPPDCEEERKEREVIKLLFDARHEILRLNRDRAKLDDWIKPCPRKRSSEIIDALGKYLDGKTLPNGTVINEGIRIKSVYAAYDNKPYQH